MAEDNIEAVFRLHDEVNEKLAKLVERHVGKKGPTTAHSQLLPQIRDRLWQISWAMPQILDLHQKKFDEISANPFQAFMQEDGTWALKVRFLVEGVYAQAWTARELAERLQPLKFKPMGLIFVRNHLIAHPNGKDGLDSWSHGAGFDDIGMRVGIARSEEDIAKPQDAGFWPNMREFYEKFLGKIDVLGDGYAFEIVED